MAQKQEDKLVQILFKEYTSQGVPKKYRGPRTDINGTNGYAWYSTVMHRWCYLPIAVNFSLDTVIRVNSAHLRNL